jgi:hypothetical protein
VASTEYDRRDFYASIVTTALEGGIGYWSAAEEYRWYFPDIDGGRAEPGPDGSANAYALIVPADEDSDGDHWPKDAGGEPCARVTVDNVRRGLRQIVSGEGQLVGEETRRRFALALREWDAGDLDAGDCDMIVQVAIFGKVIYG